MSARSKGAAFEARIRDYLKSLGFVVDRARAIVRPVGPGKWVSSPNDFFGCIDLMAVRADRAYTLFIQATTSNPTAKLPELQSMPWNFQVQKVQVWSRQNGVRSGVRVLELCGLEPGQTREMFFRLKDGDGIGCL